MTNARPSVPHKVGLLKRWKRDFKRRFGLFDPLQILPFRSHGTSSCLVVKGRVLEREGVIYDTDDAASSADATRSGDSMFGNLRTSLRRLRSDEIPQARLEMRFGSATHEVVTDDEGYFRAEIRPEQPVAGGWQEVKLRLLASMAGSEGITATARVLVPGSDAEFGVISDVDDTIVRTHATNRLAMVANVLFENANTREAFPGVGALYRALVRGADGNRCNPIFYVSKSGWNLYDLFDAFFEVHRIPHGPMFLTDLAILEPKSQAMGQGEDKLTRITKILTMYPTLSFVLIGDSGQGDPEVYDNIAREHPGRIRAVYIRDVTSQRRDRQVRRIMEGLAGEGVRALAVRDTAEAARDAAKHGLIAPDALEEILVSGQDPSGVRPRPA